jgi:oligopeptide/dipeptide ABC transporter ATP-binding protein
MLERPSAGRLLFEGSELATLSPSERKRYRRSVQAVFQDPYASLSPRMRVAEIIAEPLLVNERLSQKAAADRVAELLAMVGLPADAGTRFPHEFSGGQRQRIAIARALSLRPPLIVLDEPLSSLDVSVRAQIVNLLRDLQTELGVAYLLISHDLAVLKHMCDRIAIMYLGKLVETAEAEVLYSEPLHPYTQALLAAILPSHPDDRKSDIPISGELPSPLDPPPGCRFHTRCPHAMPICSTQEPILKQARSDHAVACHLY